MKTIELKVVIKVPEFNYDLMIRVIRDTLKSYILSRLDGRLISVDMIDNGQKDAETYPQHT